MERRPQAPFSWSEIKAGQRRRSARQRICPRRSTPPPASWAPTFSNPSAGRRRHDDSPAVVRLQHVKFTTDTASHAVDAYYQDHAQKDAHK